MLAPLELLENVRRQILIRRRPLAAVIVALAVWSGVHAATEPPAPTVPVWTAARDLASGTTLVAADFQQTGFAPGSVPAAAVGDLRSVVGRTLLVPLGRGQPAAPGQVLGSSAVEQYPGRSAIGLRIPDGDAAALLRPGDRVDLLASDLQGAATKGRVAEVLVRDAVVLTVPRIDPDSAPLDTPTSGRLVLFAVPTDDVAHVAAVGVSHFLTVIWNR